MIKVKCEQCNDTGYVQQPRTSAALPLGAVLCSCQNLENLRAQQRQPDIENEVLTIVWSTVRTTGETTLRVIYNLEFGSWTVTRVNDVFWLNNSPQGWRGFFAASKQGAVMQAVDVLGGWK